MIKTKLFQQFFIYSFGALLLRGISVLLAPVYMRTLSPDEYGVLSLCYSFICIASALIGFGLRHVLTFDYFHYDKHTQKKIINEILIIYTVVGSALFVCAIALRSLFITYVFMDRISPMLMIVVLCSTFLTFFSELHEQILQYTGRALRLTIINIINALIRIAVILTLLFGFNAGFASMVWGQWTGLFFVFCVGVYGYFTHAYHTHAHIKDSLEKTQLYLKRGAPLIPKVLLMWVLSGADRWVLAHYSSMHDVGIYSVADAFSYLFYLVILMPWKGSYLPWILREFAQHKNNTQSVQTRNHRFMIYSMIGIALFMIFCFVVFQPLLKIIIPDNYHEALNYVLIILMGQVFLLGANFAGCILHFRKQSYALLISLLVPAFLNIGLNIALVPRYGLYGCTSATLISYAVYFLLTLLLGKKKLFFGVND